MVLSSADRCPKCGSFFLKRGSFSDVQMVFQSANRFPKCRMISKLFIVHDAAIGKDRSLEIVLLGAILLLVEKDHWKSLFGARYSYW